MRDEVQRYSLFEDVGILKAGLLHDFLPYFQTYELKKPTPRLHNSKTNLETYRQIIQEKAKLSIKLKDQEHVEIETNNPINMLQNAAKEATPNSEPQRATNNVPYEIKRLIAEKRKARSTWQRTHTPDSKRKYNQTSNKLKSKLHELRNESFKAYVSSLKR